MAMIDLANLNKIGDFHHGLLKQTRFNSDEVYKTPFSPPSIKLDYSKKKNERKENRVC